MVGQSYKLVKNHWIVHSQLVKLVVWKLHFNKAVKNNILQWVET